MWLSCLSSPLGPVGQAVDSLSADSQAEEIIDTLFFSSGNLTTAKLWSVFKMYLLGSTVVLGGVVVESVDSRYFMCMRGNVG